MSVDKVLFVNCFQAEKETFEKQLHSDGKRMGQMRQKMREADVKDNENQNLHRALTELQVSILF